MNEIEKKSLEYMHRSQEFKVLKICSNPNCFFSSEGMMVEPGGTLKCACGCVQEESEMTIITTAIRDRWDHRDFQGGES